MSSDDPTSSINSISADDSAAAVPSTSAARPVHLISPRLSTSSMIPLITAPPTSSMLPMFSEHSSSPMLPMFPEPWMSPMLPIIPEPWMSPMLPIIPEPWISPMPRVRITRRNRNISCPYGLKYQKSFDFNDHRFLRHSRTPSAYEFSRLGLRGVKEPEKLDYASYESRLNSFARWPTHLRQTSEELADAGFYYIGIMDLTVCYHCGICIGNWKPEEDPWEQHAISSPTCCYLLTIRGFEYVNNVTGQQLYETSPKVPTQIANGNPKRSNSGNDTNEMTLVQKIAAAKEKNRALKNARLCKVCTEREATVVFLPCGHVATCDYCSPAFTKCIICRGELKATSSAIFL